MKPDKTIVLPHNLNPIARSRVLTSLMSQRQARPADSYFSPLSSGNEVVWPHYPHVPMNGATVNFFHSLSEDLTKRLGKPVAPMEAAALFFELTIGENTRSPDELVDAILKKS